MYKRQALATGIGQCIPAVAGVVFFLFTKKELRFTRCGFYPKETAKAAFNGSSEMVTELSTAIITFLFNIILLRLAGEHGVAAITILLYGEFLFNGFYLGFAIGISPIIGFQYGAQNRHELRRLYKIAFLFAAGTSLFMALLAFLLSGPITSVFTKDPQTYVLAVAGFKLFAVNFLFSGLNITSSGFFTALSNGCLLYTSLYHSSVKPPHTTRERESLKDNTTRTAIGIYKNAIISAR